MEWISVKDRLPETGPHCEVLFYADGEIHFGWRSQNGAWMAIGETREVDLDPSHWMPLPEPPEVPL